MSDCKYSAEQDFHKLINRLAAICDFELDSMLIGIYDEHLHGYGYENVNEALKTILVTRQPRDQFPSVTTIIETMGGAASDKSLAVAATNAILATFRKWKLRYCADPNFENWFLEHNGEVAWVTVCQMGGYAALFSEYDNMGTNLTVLRSQIRDMAVSVIERARAGQLHQPVALPGLEESKRLLQLVEEKKA